MKKIKYNSKKLVFAFRAQILNKPKDLFNFGRFFEMVFNFKTN